MSNAKTLFLECKVMGRLVNSVIDTGATISAISAKFTDGCDIRREKALPIQVGNGQLLFSRGVTEIEVALGSELVKHECMVVDTEAFEAVLGMDFLHGNQMINGLLFHPPRLVVNNKEIRLREEACPKINTMFRLFQTESYRLISDIRSRALQDLHVNPLNVCIDLFASAKNNVEDVFCCKQNSAWSYHWGSLLKTP
jgi:hypothetical protein